MKSWVSRSAAWHFTTAEENPDEVVAALDDKTEAVTNAESNQLEVCFHGRSMSDMGPVSAC
jgi:hypothetical protein